MGISRRGGLLPQAAGIVPSGNREGQENVLKVQIKLEQPLFAKAASVPEQMANR